ncbi:MAG: hypothetical protein KGH69_03240 [Candidatus Micrarchaeota archaeon]|nr:hypothetical protein [Candidatus Micrarchaeota archaeon]
MPSGIWDQSNRELLIVAVVVASSLLSMALFILRLPVIAVMATSLVAIGAGLYLLRWLSNATQEPPAGPKRGRSRRR